MNVLSVEELELEAGGTRQQVRAAPQLPKAAAAGLSCAGICQRCSWVLQVLVLPQLGGRQQCLSGHWFMGFVPCTQCQFVVPGVPGSATAVVLLPYCLVWLYSTWQATVDFGVEWRCGLLLCCCSNGTFCKLCSCHAFGLRARRVHAMQAGWPLQVLISSLTGSVV